MPNDTPFIPLPSPPRSPSQSDSDADMRGYDFGPTVPNDDGARARAYAIHLNVMAQGKRDVLMRLVGSRSALKTLWRKTMALTDAAPAYVESED